MTRSELLPLATLEDRDVGRWRELASRAAEPNPFFEPEYALPLARATGQLEGTALLVARDGNQWTACLPVRSVPRWHRVPLRSLSTWRAHVLYGLLGTPLVDAGALDRACSALADGLLSDKASWFSGLEWMVEGGPVLGALESALTGRGAQLERFEGFERAFLDRRPQQDYADETVSPKHRRELRRQRRKLGEALGDEVIVSDLAGQDSAVDELIALEAGSAVAGRGTVLASDPRHAEFFKQACRAFADAGRLQLLALTAGQTTLALKCNVVAGDGAFMLKIAYDEDYRSFSPGMQLETEMLNFFQERPKILWMDSCADPNNEMINRLWPDRRALTTLVASRPGARGLASRQAVRAVGAIRNRQTGG